MSVDICLYRLSDAKFQNKGLFSIPNKEFEKMTNEELDALWETKDTDRFEDGVAHELVDLTVYKWYFGHKRGWKRVRDKFDQLPIRSGVVDGTGCVHKYIVADYVYYPSSWHVLNRRYYKKDTWLVLCTTKDEVVRFFERYGNKKYGEYKLVLNTILEKWDDKCFLLVSY